MGKVKFIQCTLEEYNSLETKDSDTLYFISNRNIIYKGELPFPDSVTSTKDGIMSAADKTKLDSIELASENSVIYIPDENPIAAGTLSLLGGGNIPGIKFENSTATNIIIGDVGGSNGITVNTSNGGFQLDEGASGGVQARLLVDGKISAETIDGSAYARLSISNNTTPSIEIEGGSLYLNGETYTKINQVPEGGSEGQVLTKTSSTGTNEFEWKTPETALPSYTEADNGKFLQIVDGVPTWVSIENAEGVSF